MRCCSCRRCEVSSLRLAALRQSAATYGGCRGAASNLDGSPAASAFAVYCSCTKQRRIPVASTYAGTSISPATAANLMFTRWRYWSLMFRQQFLRDLENSALMSRHRLHHHHQQQKRQRQLLIRKPPGPVFGKTARVSTTSARHFSCPSCSYSTDRKNNLKRHVTTMHRRPDYAAVTSSGGNHDDSETRNNIAGCKRARTPDASPVIDVAWTPHPRNHTKIFISP